MNTNAITHEDRFTEMEMFSLFNVECLPGGERKDGSRLSTDNEPYVFNDILVPLWTKTKRELSRGEAAAVQSEDNIKPGISNNAVGSKARVADLAAFYAENGEAEKSAFYV